MTEKLGIKIHQNKDGYQILCDIFGKENVTVIQEAKPVQTVLDIPGSHEEIIDVEPKKKKGRKKKNV